MRNNINRGALDKILRLLPEYPGSFKGTDFKLPVKAAISGGREIEIAPLRETLCGLRNTDNVDVKKLLEPVLLAAELYESARKDNEKYFLKDERLQGLVFMGAKWTPGWSGAWGKKAGQTF